MGEFFENIGHFQELRKRINIRLLNHFCCLSDEEQKIVIDQICEYPWLYGALGKVPSNEMFIAENPSITGIRHANVDTVDGEPPDIEAQWWGGKNNKAAKVFRQVLCDLKLKSSSPNTKGGWNCYITNVIKRANYAKENEKVADSYRLILAEIWAPTLEWEIKQVQPRILYCLGRRTEKVVKYLQKNGLIPNLPAHYVIHYSARGELSRIRETMKSQIYEARQKQDTSH